MPHAKFGATKMLRSLFSTGNRGYAYKRFQVPATFREGGEDGFLQASTKVPIAVMARPLSSSTTSKSTSTVEPAPAPAPAALTDVITNTKTKVKTKTKRQSKKNTKDVESSVIDLNVASNDKGFTLTTLDAPPMHMKTKRWIFFSDLHVKLSSIETCEKVLDIVNEEAMKREAGIVFLGDFWHVRGALNVELLNRVMRSLRKWKCPVIMIPGNHDQVTLGGSVHSLEPLQYAFAKDQILMISDPCICLGALWIPYRRDHELLKSILADGFKREDFNAIFCHAEVQGAYMNDNIKSKDGISVDLFPHNKIVYSGHFHKPHTVKKSQCSLRYLGSPYQTSLSEAGQEKYLYCLSSNESRSNATHYRTWLEEDRFAIEVGKKYYRASNFNDPILLKAKQGDRVVVKVGRNESYEEVFDELKGRGVEVELRMQSRSPLITAKQALKDTSNYSKEEFSPIQENEPIKSISNESEDNPIRIFEEFVTLPSVKLATEKAVMIMDESQDKTETETETETENVYATFETLYENVVEEGRSTLERIMSSVDMEGSTATSAGGVSKNAIGSGKIRELRLDHITLKDFGPYGGNPIRYPLSDRGLVLLRGESSDGTGADSNGAGKTTLAMSVMWALTGSMDARLIADGKAVDVAYDTDSKLANKKNKKRIAEVTLTGVINGSPFRIERKRGARKVELNFWIDDKEQTQLSVKDTQAIIDDILGVGGGLLQRCCFYGQHSHTLQSLLGLTDIKLKSEMSLLVDTELWTTALQDVKARDRACKTRVNEITVEERMRKQEILRTKESVEESINKHRLLQQKRDSDIEKLKTELGEVNSTKTLEYNGTATILKDINSKKALLSEHKTDVLDPLIERSMMRSSSKLDDTLVAVDKCINTINERIFEIKTSLASLQNSSYTLSKKSEMLNENITEVIRFINTSVSKYFMLAGGAKANVATFTNPLTEEDVELLTGLTTNGVIKMKEKYDDALRRYASVDSELKQSTKSLHALASVTDCMEGNDTNNDNCPTCGQPLLAETREDRQEGMKANIKHLKIELLSLDKERNSTKNALNELEELRKLMEQLDSLENFLIDVESRVADEDLKITSQSEEIERLKESIDIESAKKKKIQSERQLENESLNNDVKLAQKKSDQLNRELEEMNVELEEARKYENSNVEAQMKIDSLANYYEGRLQDSQKILQAQSSILFKLEEEAKESGNEKIDLKRNSIILEQLASIIGPRGIQHYIFTGVLRLLESIANSYLSILADGGIQLSLHSDEDADKIVKSVLIRASDGKYHERALSQLSGGQWRRVSMSLDFAFAEVVRRKGTLRSNFIVMDEVLTHLDASGREAVGSVLRALVAKKCDNDNKDEEGVQEDDQEDGQEDDQEWVKDLLGGGSYDTVLIILQDLAATELEEAFDHIDVVVKERDISMVEIDGLIN